MFSKFTSMISHAVGAISTHQPVQQEFVTYWKALTSYFVDNKDQQTCVEQTNLPQYLTEMLRILVDEETVSETGSTGPCMEYLLQHGILETLYTLARTDCPAGMKQLVLQFFTKLLSRIKQPLLPHVHVHRPVQRLVRMCGEVKAGPTETEEIKFLCTVCAKLKSDPYLVNFFIQSERTVAANTSTSQQSNKSSSSSPSKTLSPSFTVIDSLLNLMHSEDGRVSVKACEGLMLCASLPDENGAFTLVNHTQFCSELTQKLIKLYNKLPNNMDPSDVECVTAKWGLDMLCEADDLKGFHGKRQLTSFLSWLDYCDQLIGMSQPMVAESLASYIRKQFFQAILQPALLQPSEAGAVLATSYAMQCIRVVWSPQLLRELVFFLIGEHRYVETTTRQGDHKLRYVLIQRCDHVCEQLSIITMKLFGTLLRKPCEHIIHNLLLRNLLTREYLKDPAEISVQPYVEDDADDSSDSAIANGEGEEDEEMTKKSQLKNQRKTGDVGAGDMPVISCAKEEARESSAQSTPEHSCHPQTPVHMVVHSYLGLLPEDAKSSFQTTESGYDIYLRDAHKQLLDTCNQCLSFQWPTQPIVNNQSNSETEGQLPSVNFFEGHFLKVLFDKICRMLDQSYDINLQLTALMSLVALMPHPNLHEYLLNPFLPAKHNCRTLFSCLKKLAHDTETKMKATADFQKQLLAVRKQLIGFNLSFRSLDDSNLLAGVIVLEEFCKELAAVVFVKHHDTEMQA